MKTDSEHFGSRWHLVLTKPSSERVAVTNLERQGYQVYFPRLRQKIVRNRAWCEKITALFPRYLFVKLTQTMQSLAPMRSTLGVATVVRFGTEYVLVPDGVVQSLRCREDEHGFHQILESKFRCGAPVRIVDGPLAGLEAVFQCDDGAERVVVLLNILGRETRIKLPAFSVAAAV